MAKIIVVFLPVIIIGLIVIALIIYAVYSSIYKKKINKKLEGNESTAHVSMASTESIGRIILIVGAIIFAISTLSMLSNISENVCDTQINMNNTINSLRSEITDLKEQLEEQNSVFVEFMYEYGEVDTENHTVELKFECIPKTAGEDTAIVLTLGNESAELKKDSDGRYKGTGDFSIFFPYCSNLLASITTNDVTTFYDISDGFSGTLFSDFIGLYCAELHLDGVKYDVNEFTVTGVYEDWAKGDFYNQKLIFCVNGEDVKEIEINGDMFEINESVPINDYNDIIDIYVEATDKYGYIHRQMILNQVIYSGESMEEYIVMDKNRNILYRESGYTEE